MKTIIEGIDPRSKLVIVLCLSTLGVFINDIFILLYILLVSFMAAAVFGAPLLSTAKRLKKYLLIFISIAVIQSVFSPSGETILAFGNLSLITWGGLEKSAAMIQRIAIVIVSAVIMTTTSSRKIIQGLVQWKIPYELAFMTYMAIRFLPLLMDEIKDALTAVQLRGIDLKKIHVRNRIKVYSYLFMPVIAGALLKSQDLSTAMETKAFRAYPQRTSYFVLYMGQLDYILIFSSLTITVVVILFHMI